MARTRRSQRPGRQKAPGVQDRALLLRRTPFGETSLVVHVLTESSGRVELIAKGAHRPKSRFSGVLDWFDTLDLEWSAPSGPEENRGRGDELTRLRALSTLRSGDLDRRRRRITESLAAYRAAHTALELTDLATRAGGAEEGYFELLGETLDQLDASAAASLPPSQAATQLDGLVAIPYVLARFELRLLRALGVEPSLLVCAACGEAAPPIRPQAGPATAISSAPFAARAPFAPRAGGRLCALHAEEARSAGLRVGTLPVDVLEGAHALLNGQGADFAGHASRSPDFGERVLDFAGRFLDHQLETRPKSHAEFLGAPDRNAKRRDRTP
ncbi:MAG: recombination protein O N-terminal domain-containing protein [Planctomycetota bacterium]